MKSSQTSWSCCCPFCTTSPTPHWLTHITLTNEKLWNILTLLPSFMYHLSTTSLANTKALKHPGLAVVLHILYHLSNTALPNTFYIDQLLSFIYHLYNTSLTSIYYIGQLIRSPTSWPCCCPLCATYPTPHWLTHITLTNEKISNILTLLLPFIYHLSNTSLAKTYYIDQWKALKHPDLVVVLYIPPIQRLIG